MVAKSGTLMYASLCGWVAVGLGTARAEPGCTPPFVDCFPTLACPGGKSYEPVQGGLDDDFCTPTEPATPGPELATSGFCTNSSDFDSTAIDRPFCHTLYVPNIAPFAISSAFLEIRLRPGSSYLACNDTLSLQVTGSGFAWGRRIGTGGVSCTASPPGLLGTPWQPGAGAQTLCLDLGALANVSGPPTDLVPYLVADGRLDVRIQDDTNVDYMRLWFVGCPCADPPSDMVAWWTMDESAGPTAFDIQGGHDGTHLPAGEPIPTPYGEVDGGLVLDGVDDHVSAPHAASLDPGAEAFSIDAWVNAASPANGGIVRKFDDTAHLGYVFTLIGGTPGLILEAPSIRCAVLATTGVLGGWNHVAVTVSECTGSPPGRTVSFYVNGVPAGVFSPVGCCNINNNEPVLIGSADQFGQPFLDGVIDEVEVFDRELSGAEVASIFDAHNAGKCKPDCTDPPAGMVGWWPLDEPGGAVANEVVNDNDGAYLPSAVSGPVSQAGFVDRSRDFDGVDDLVETPANAELTLGVTDFTVDAWVRWVPGGDPNNEIATQDGYRFRLVTNANGDAGLLLWLTNGVISSQSQTHKCVKFYVVPPNEWVHVAATLEQNVICKLYVNGQLVGSSIPPNLFNLSTNGKTRIGQAFGGNSRFKGSIDEVEIFDRALDQSEIQAIYEARTAGKCKCRPTADGSGCEMTACSDPNRVCVPTCAIAIDELTTRVTACECRDPLDCHVELPALGLPHCAGDCPPGEVCTETLTDTPLGSEICCDCGPATEACCFSDGSCQDLDPLTCDELSGTAQGSGTACLGDNDLNGFDDACEPPPVYCAAINFYCSAHQDDCIVPVPTFGVCEPNSVTLDANGLPIVDACECCEQDCCGGIQIDEPIPGVVTYSCHPVDCAVPQIGYCQIFADGVPTGEVSVDGQKFPAGTQLRCDCADTCPLPAAPEAPLCAALQSTDCPTTTGGQSCRPICLEMQMGPVGPEPVATVCDCADAAGACGPVRVTPVAGTMDYDFACDGDCAVADDLCQIRIDGVPQGVTTISSTMVPVGSEVKCGCSSAYCPLPPAPPIPLCADLQQEQCLFGGPNELCEATGIHLVDDGTGVLTPMAAKCDCLADGECRAVYDPLLDPPVYCEGFCPTAGVTCALIIRDSDGDGVDDLYECRCPVDCCLPDGSCTTTTQFDCLAQGGTVVPACLGDANTNGVDDACDVDCCLATTCVTIADVNCQALGGTEVSACLGDGDLNGIDDACEEPLCPLPANSMCSDLQPTDCPSSGVPGEECVPRVAQIVGSLPKVVECYCCDQACCMLDVNGTTLSCPNVCPDPDDLCQIHANDIPTGLSQIESTDPQYLGNFIRCDCAPTLGACCLPDGSCTDAVTAAQCAAAGGIFEGAGSLCQGVEACCHTDPLGNVVCDDMDALCCVAHFGGVPQGNGSICLGDADMNGIDDACEPPQCIPLLDGSDCAPAVCPIVGEKCRPQCVIYDPGTGETTVTDCECRSQDECQVVITPAPSVPHCEGTCPDGEICVETVTQQAGGTMEICCHCEPDPDACMPLPDETDCAPAMCLDPAEECIPACLRFDPVTGMHTVVDCDCRPPNECHPEPSPLLPPLPPRCVGDCPPGEICVETVTTDAGTGLIDVCCRCDPVCPLPTPPAVDPCATLQARDCVSDNASLVCLPKIVQIVDDGVGNLVPIATECECSDDTTCGPVTITQDAAGYTISCENVCPNPPGGQCVVFFGTTSTGMMTVNVVDLPADVDIICDCDTPPPDVCPLPTLLPDDPCAGLQSTDCAVEATCDDVCYPVCAHYDQLTGLTTVTECECAAADECHLQILPGAAPSCVGTCEDGTACVENVVDDGAGGLDICCSCCPQNDLDLDITTGVDDAGGLLGTGADDDTWTVSSEPPPVGTLPRPATVINANTAWFTLPGSRWISANATGPNGQYTYQFCFCLDERFQNAQVVMDLLADDQAFVYLNGQFIGQTPSPGFNVVTHVQTNDQSQFNVGTNCIEVVVENQFGVVTGFNLVGSVTAANGVCCCGPESDGSACAPVDCPVPTDECQPQCVRYDPATGAQVVLECACRDVDGCHVEFLPPPLGPRCVGNCNTGEVCSESQTIDPITGQIELCCCCEPEPGACCYDADGDGISESCSVVSQSECDALMGTYQGDGSVCLGTGACCFGIIGGACVEVDEVCCDDILGSFVGTGTVCLGDGNGNGVDDVCETGGNCPNDTVEECCDLDADGVTDDVCTWCACDAMVCSTQAKTVPADLGGAFGACAIDGFCNIHDANHALACFSGLGTCEELNIDAGGAFGACPPDGFCNIHDANHALTCFGGLNTCSCPSSPAPISAPRVVGAASLSVVADARVVHPGDEVVVRVFADQGLERLQSYQLQVGVSGGRRGTLELTSVSVEDRPDVALGARAERFAAFNSDKGQMLAGRVNGSVTTAAGAYLATFTYKVSADAIGAFVIDVLHDESGGDQTYLVSSFVDKIAVKGTHPAAIPVTGRSKAINR